MTGIDLKLTAHTELTTIADEDLFYVVHDPSGTPLWRKITRSNLLKGMDINLKAATELTIATGAITITQSAHKLQPESGTADVLSTISGMAAGEVAFLFVSDAGTKTITVEHGTGNISCVGEADIVLSNGMIVCYSDGTTIYVSGGGGGGSTPATTAPTNLLINGGFDFFQRGGVAAQIAMTDDAYNAPDRWYSLIQGVNATIGRLAGGSKSTNTCKLVAGGTTNRHGIAQIVESVNSIPLRESTVIAQCLVKPVKNAGAGTTKMRIAVLEWTGTADAVTSELVADWTSGTFTTAGFFSSTTLTLIGTASVTANHNEWTQLSVSGAVSAACNNLIIFIWTEDVPDHAADYVLLCEAGLYSGSTVQAWEPRAIQQELNLCLRYFEKNIPLDTTPADNVDYAISLFYIAMAAGNAFRGHVDFKVYKMATPTMTFYRTSVGASNGKWSYAIVGTAWYPTGTVTIDAVNDAGFFTAMADNGTNHPTNYYTYQLSGVWTASAEL
jgi:hypothetical protein